MTPALAVRVAGRIFRSGVFLGGCSPSVARLSLCALHGANACAPRGPSPRCGQTSLATAWGVPRVALPRARGPPNGGPRPSAPVPLSRSGSPSVGVCCAARSYCGSGCPVCPQSAPSVALSLPSLAKRGHSGPPRPCYVSCAATTPATQGNANHQHTSQPRRGAAGRGRWGVGWVPVFLRDICNSTPILPRSWRYFTRAGSLQPLEVFARG